MMPKCIVGRVAMSMTIHDPATDLALFFTSPLK
jgi:hypothetical protein